MTQIARIRSSIAIMIDCAGSARRASADYRRLARVVPNKANVYAADADRKKIDARWYLRRARESIVDLTVSS